MSTTSTEKTATATVHPIKKTRQSAASRKSALNDKPPVAKPATKPAAKPAAKDTGPTKTQVNHAVCAQIMVALESDSKKISDAQLRKLGFTRATYVEKISEYMDYLPVAPGDWNVDYFGHKEGRGGRPTTHDSKSA